MVIFSDSDKNNNYECLTFISFRKVDMSLNISLNKVKGPDNLLIDQNKILIQEHNAGGLYIYNCSFNLYKKVISIHKVFVIVSKCTFKIYFNFKNT